MVFMLMVGGHILSDETHPEFFKILEQNYYSNKEKFLFDLEFLWVKFYIRFYCSIRKVW